MQKRGCGGSIMWTPAWAPRTCAPSAGAATTIAKSPAAMLRALTRGCAPSCRGLAVQRHVAAAAPHCRGLATGQRFVAAAEPPLVDEYVPNRGWVRGWRAWSESTLSIVTMRRHLPNWGVPEFRTEAVQLYEQVSIALAAGDVKALRKLTTSSCFAPLQESIKKRPAGQRHSWVAQQVAASVLQVRLAHSAQTPDVKFAQVTCAVKGKLVWRIEDAAGAQVGGLGSDAEPFEVDDLWVFERSLAASDQWRIKCRLVLKDPDAG